MAYDGLAVEGVGVLGVEVAYCTAYDGLAVEGVGVLGVEVGL